MSDSQQVGVVLVSHSAEVAESVARLALGLAGGDADAPDRPVAAAGGTADGGLGTAGRGRAAGAARPGGSNKREGQRDVRHKCWKCGL